MIRWALAAARAAAHSGPVGILVELTSKAITLLSDRFQCFAVDLRGQGRPTWSARTASCGSDRTRRLFGVFVSAVARKAR